MFLTNFNSSVEFAISSGILSGGRSYHMESSPPICNITPWTGFCMVGDFSGGYSQTDYNFNFDINVNVTVESYMNRSFNFGFSHLLKDLLAFRIMKLESTSKITTKFETIPQCLLFLIAFMSLYSLTSSSSPRCTFIKLKACKQIEFFILDFIYICDEPVSFHFGLLCKFYTV